MAESDGTRPTPAALLARAEAWRRWRAYAAQHLWTSDGAAMVAKSPGSEEEVA
jgi:DNA-3-methyladenine glycosylase II/AraC family transcriptional regulator of adaptative response / DNA-3-methyladenine glycosylase II